jgi:hypothetical protein
MSLAARRSPPLLVLVVCACSGHADGGVSRGSMAKSGSSVAGTGTGTANVAIPPGNPGANTSSSLIVPVSTPVNNASTAGAGGAGMMKQASNRDPIAIDDCAATNPAGISLADAQALKAGGAPGALQLVYPYGGTVFPRGLLAPELMWQGAVATAVYVHIKSKIFEYSGCLKPTAAGRLTLPQDIWDQAAARTFGKDDPYTLELSVLSQGKVMGPVVRTLQIAQATIKGSIYYNSYSSQLGQGAANSGAAQGGFFGGGPMGGLVLRIPAGGKAELFGQTGCNGCHSVSADGSRLLSQFVGTGGQSYELMAGGIAGTPVMAGMRGAFGALYPDGSAYVSGSSVVEVARSNMTSQGQMADATLHDAKTGAVIPAVGIPKGALMPSLSPDGTYLAFNDYAVDAAHGLAIMKYDVKTHTASDYKVLTQEPAAGKLRPGWPFVLPDNGAVVFVRTDGTDWSGDGAGVMMQAGGFGAPAAGPAPASDLSIIDVGSGQVSLLAKAMGYDTPDDAQSGKTYLPFGAEELHHNYFPTVSPVAAGGYFWVFFDSVRHYGVLGAGRQLWGAAIDISPDGTYKTDLSHPAFYLPGQELGTGNHRAFAALDPCRKDGDKCTSGIDCCGGFCYFEGPEEFDRIGSCTPKKMMCAKRDERCTSDADCCPPAPGEQPNTCIAGFCAYIPPLN